MFGYKRKRHEYFNPGERNPIGLPDYYSTKTVALKVSRSVVSLESFSGETEIFKCSGTIIENIDNYSIILTAARLLGLSTNRTNVPDDIKVVVHLSGGGSLDGEILAYDFHYNIAAIRIQPDAPLPTACVTRLNDCIPIDPSPPHVTTKKSFQLCPHPKSFDLVPGDLVVAVGRFIGKPYNIMAAPGEFCLWRCGDEEFGCKELFMSTCKITKCGIGGPLINCYGEVIGICFHEFSSTPFLPINIASSWWEQYKRIGQTRRPWLGMELISLHAATLTILESIMPKFPDVLQGVIVEEVVPGSSAESAGIKDNDVITQFAGKRIQNFLEFFENMWNNVGESVELVVIRANSDDLLHLHMIVDEATPENFYSWPTWGDTHDSDSEESQVDE